MQYFTLQELTYSQTAAKNGIKNVPGEEEEKNLIAPVSAVLDPLRKAYGKPVKVSSGYRCPKLNKAVGGVATSQHIKGEAADLDTGSKTENRKLMKLIVDLGLPFDQLIDEAGYAWVHVSYKRVGDNRGQMLRMRGGKYTMIKPADL